MSLSPVFLHQSQPLAQFGADVGVVCLSRVKFKERKPVMISMRLYERGWGDVRLGEIIALE